MQSGADVRQQIFMQNCAGDRLMQTGAAMSPACQALHCAQAVFNTQRPIATIRLLVSAMEGTARVTANLCWGGANAAAPQTDQRVCVRVELGLVMKFEFAVRQRVTQAVFHVEAFVA